MTEYILEVVVADQCSVFFWSEKIYKNSWKNKSNLPYNFIL